jgi:hypothetical protein
MKAAAMPASERMPAHPVSFARGRGPDRVAAVATEFVHGGGEKPDDGRGRDEEWAALA